MPFSLCLKKEKMYLASTPWWLRIFYPTLEWQVDTTDKCIYLTFDDGPHETATPFVLDMLKQFDAKATFFCIGNNVRQHKEIYNRIIAEGHSVGNHTQNHLNGWKTSDYNYIKDISIAGEHIKSTLFRPPYGRIRRSQIKKLQLPDSNLRIIMWSVLSGDFDTSINGGQCLQNVLKYSKEGSIVVFHDSAKAWERLQYALPKTLEYFSKKSYKFKGL
jgi:peptidoglycan/xylan/chitin deacetylase (PgdA/CDA1 family)